MLFIDRIKCFIALGEKLKSLPTDELEDIIWRARNENSWFTEKSIKQSLQGIVLFLEKETLEAWADRYNTNPDTPKKIGVIAAGNIPLVGFHDVLSVLISGHKLMLKPSSDDTFLMKYIFQLLVNEDDRIAEYFSFVDRLNEADAYIATGSDNSARYFQYYFKDKPCIIRANRSSIGVIRGDESKDQLRELGKDIFQFYGLGCRNVSKLLVPEGYQFKTLLDSLAEYEYIGDHHKYRNNYDYNKSIYLVNGEAHLDNGFLLVRESKDMVSPISVLYYEHYSNSNELEELLEEKKDKLQCVVGEEYISFGQAQLPQIDDYADGVDTMSFLEQL